jgi:hypothetical protein
MFDTFNIYNCFKISDALSPLPSSHAFKYATKVYAKEEGLKLRVNVAHQPMVSADD